MNRHQRRASRATTNKDDLLRDYERKISQLMFDKKQLQAALRESNEVRKQQAIIIRAAEENKKVEFIVSDEVEGIQRMMPLEDYERDMQGAFNQGVRLMQEIYTQLNDDHSAIRFHLEMLMAELVGLRTLAHDRQAGLPLEYYYDMLKYFSTKILFHAGNWQNTLAESNRRWQLPSGQGHDIELAPVIDLVGNAQQAIANELAGQAGAIMEVFSRHGIHEAFQEALANLNRGGRPSAERDYSTYLRSEARELLSQDDSLTHGQIAGSIMRKLRDKLDKQGALLAMERDALNALTTSKRPDRVISRVLGDQNGT